MSKHILIELVETFFKPKQETNYDVKAHFHRLYVLRFQEGKIEKGCSLTDLYISGGGEKEYTQAVNVLMKMS
ncbi:hypothetical protein NVP1101O_126 [Vibrio phage 1.101.O._10N.261.45.C6]|nr:hypothetical protein NVP1101O_126 [Vibrio phage 1.101.O._10N.261.45.C6]